MAHPSSKNTLILHVNYHGRRASVILAQRHVAEHSNEKTTLPLLLEQLEMAGCIVSIDAMGCHPKIAKQIKEQDAEYVLALKAN